MYFARKMSFKRQLKAVRRKCCKSKNKATGFKPRKKDGTAEVSSVHV